MNKSIISFLGALIAVGMVACDDKLAVAPPQANEQGPVLEGYEGAYATLSVSSVDLKAELQDGNEYVKLYTVDAGTSGLSQSDLWGQFEVSNSATFEQSVILEDYEDMVGTVSLNDLNEAHAQLFGVSPYEKTVYYRVLLYANVDGNTYRIGSTDTYGASGTYTEYNYDPGYEIQETYYIIGVQGWDPLSDCVKMSHSDESAYDDPYFTYEFESEGTTYWKLVPPDIYDQLGNAGFDVNNDFWPNLYYGVADADNNYSGTLYIGNEDAPWIPAGSWTITVNMKNLTYEVTGTPAGMPDWVGTPNTYQDWTISTSMMLAAYGENYKGFSYFGGEWGGKLAYSMGDSDIWLGQIDGTEAEFNGSESDPMWTVQLSDSGGNIFQGKDPEMYFISFDFSSKVAYFHQIMSCGIIGGFNDWGSQEPMSVVEGSNGMKWSGSFTFNSDTEFKFRFNDTWDINLGGAANDLKCDGDNISVTAGSYEIVLDITNVPYSYTITAK